MKKKVKKLLIGALVAVGVFALILFWRFVVGGTEDSWICSAGEWVKHGNPTEAMPSGSCA